MEIEKKVWPEYFEKILDKEKNFELRLADFKCREGDILVLKEWDPETRKYTGRIIEKKVKYVLKIKDIKFWPKEEIDKYGFQIISFKNVPRGTFLNFSILQPKQGFIKKIKTVN